MSVNNHRYEPMLAAPMKKGVITNWAEWNIEEKYDGHRLMVYVNRGYDVQAHARPRSDGRMVERALPPHLKAELGKLPDGVYDGELMGGDVSTDVTRKDLAHTRSFVIFDCVRIGNVTTIYQTYGERRTMLEGLFAAVAFDPKVVRLATSLPLSKEEDVTRFVKAVWKTGGEGAILKKRDSLYFEGQRAGKKSCPLVWIKIKRVEHATLTVVGFEPSQGTVRFPGHPFAKLKLRDEDGNETTVKTLNDFELNRLEQQWKDRQYERRKAQDDYTGIERHHPAIGRKLVIEFQQRLRDGSYRGPVLWDRWEDE